MERDTETSDWPRVSVAIPLYESRRFLDTIIANIESIDYPDVEVLISDRHCKDDTIDALQDRYRDDARIRVLAATDEIGWIEHYNTLLREATGKYFRWLPHDDIIPRCGLREMVSHLEANADTVLVYGPTEAIDSEGNPLPRRSDPDPHPISNDAPWTFAISMNLFFRGYCNGAFKGLFRRGRVLDEDLFIRQTLDGVHAERCWLFALSLLSRFSFLPGYRYTKRYHDRSTSARWKIRYRHRVSACRVMRSYLKDLVPDRKKVMAGTAALLVGLCVPKKLREKVRRMTPERIRVAVGGYFRRL